MYIYITTCDVNGKVYVGKCKRSIEKSKKYIGSGILLRHSINKHGIENFHKSILEECNEEVLNEREQYWIAFYDSTNKEIGYNLTKGGEGGDTISNHPELDRISRNYSEWNKSYWTDEKKKERSLKTLGVLNPFFGKFHSIDSKDKISSKNLNRVVTDETKRQISNSLKSKYESGELVQVMSEETKEKISKANTGRKHSDESKLKISNSSIGKNNSSSKKWTFIHIDGTVVLVEGEFAKFIYKNNLSSKIMRNIAEGKRKELFYNGWTVRKNDERVEEENIC